ncbi:MTH1187 family thiamine-binding protein [Natronococcus sp.]|uniref:MTH1187 family thiamine-binding protein n=1 Tax=Natronococcus sp. TaxID=35747 RepID=UPI003A4DB07D
MTVFALLRVTPITDDDVTEDVAAAIDALEEYDVEYETTPMATTLEAEDVEELFAACGAAHKAVEGSEVQTLVQVDDKREKSMTADDKVDAVESELGREARSDGD